MDQVATPMDQMATPVGQVVALTVIPGAVEPGRIPDFETRRLQQGEKPEKMTAKD
jgi:hypothetical protein